MSDPSVAWNMFMRGSFKTKGIRKSTSETERVDAVGVDGSVEVEASHLHDGLYSASTSRPVIYTTVSTQR